MQEFQCYVCEGDSIESDIGGIRYVARIARDTDSHIDDDDCHNIDQSVTGCNDEQFARLLRNRKAWFDDEWFYCGIVVDAYLDGVLICENAASLWGIEANYPETDNSYLTSVAFELFQEAGDDAGKALKRLQEKLREVTQ